MFSLVAGSSICEDKEVRRNQNIHLTRLLAIQSRSKAKIKKLGGSTLAPISRKKNLKKQHLEREKQRRIDKENALLMDRMMAPLSNKTRENYGLTSKRRNTIKKSSQNKTRREEMARIHRENLLIAQRLQDSKAMYSKNELCSKPQRITLERRKKAQKKELYPLEKALKSGKLGSPKKPSGTSSLKKKAFVNRQRKVVKPSSSNDDKNEDITTILPEPTSPVVKIDVFAAENLQPVSTSDGEAPFKIESWNDNDVGDDSSSIKFDVFAAENTLETFANDDDAPFKIESWNTSTTSNSSLTTGSPNTDAAELEGKTLESFFTAPVPETCTSSEAEDKSSLLKTSTTLEFEKSEADFEESEVEESADENPLGDIAENTRVIMKGGIRCNVQDEDDIYGASESERLSMFVTVSRLALDRIKVTASPVTTDLIPSVIESEIINNDDDDSEIKKLVKNNLVLRKSNWSFSFDEFA